MDDCAKAQKQVLMIVPMVEEDVDAAWIRGQAQTAAMFGQHVTALIFARRVRDHGLSGFLGEVAARARTLQARYDSDVAEVAKVISEATFESDAAVSFEVRDAPADLHQAVADEARLHDLVVLRINTGLPDDRGLLSAALYQAGRPAICARPLRDLGARSREALVAWRPNRQCTRAIADATGALREMERTTLLHVQRSAEPNQTGALLQTVDYLRRIGVRAEAMSMAEDDLPLDELILKVAREGGYDLLVLGAPSSPLEISLKMDGTTMRVIAQSSAPVFLSA